MKKKKKKQKNNRERGKCDLNVGDWKKWDREANHQLTKSR